MYVSKVLDLIARVLDFGTPEFILKGQRGGNSYGIIKNEKRNDRIEEEKLGGGWKHKLERENMYRNN